MHLYEFIGLTCNFESTWKYLCDKKVIRSTIVCPRCENELRLVNSAENHIFHCTHKYYKVINKKKRRKITCNFKISAFHGTWFQRAHIDVIKICRFIGYFLFMMPPRHRFFKNELQMEDHIVVDWTNFCREVIKFRI